MDGATFILGCVRLDVQEGIEGSVIFSIVFRRESYEDKVNTGAIFSSGVVPNHRGDDVAPPHQTLTPKQTRRPSNFNSKTNASIHATMDSTLKK